MPQTNQKVKTLEEITGTKKGMKEYEISKKLGAKRRENTGIVGKGKKINAFEMGSYLAKFFSVLGSAFGFATILIIASNREMFTNVFWLLFVVGLLVGVAFEYFSTANEDAFLGLEDLPMVIIGIGLIVAFKSYAVFMHVQSANQLAQLAIKDITSSTISDTPKTATLKTQIAELKVDIADKKDEKKTEAYTLLMLNTTSTHKAKRNSATVSVKAIEDDLKAYKADKKAKEAELATLTTTNISTTKQSVTKNSEDVTLAFLMLLIIFELGGTLFSILGKYNTNKSVSSDIMLTEEVMETSYNNQSAREETKTRNKAFTVANDVTNNHVNLHVAQSDLSVRNDKIIIDTELTNIEIEYKSKYDELLIKRREFDTERMNREIDNINSAMANIKTIDVNTYRAVEHQSEDSRKIGFNTNMTKDDIKTMALSSIDEDGKIRPKSKLIDITNRSQKNIYENAMKELTNSGQIELIIGRGYYKTYDY